MTFRSSATGDIGPALLALFCGVASSACLKGMSLPAGPAITLRALIALTLLSTLVVWRWRRGAGGPLSPSGALRAGLDGLAGLTFALAVFELPLGLLAAIHATVPLVSVALAALILREPLGPRVLVALGLGLVGILIISAPGLEASPRGLVLALVSVFAYAARDLVTRRLRPGTDMVKSVTLSTLLILLGALLTASGGLMRPSPPDLGLLLLAVAGFLGANTLIITAFRRAPVARIAPLRYSSILWSLLFDALLWAHVPDRATWAGIALVVGAGAVLLAPLPRKRTP
ncbi:DMT family transporter [Oceanicola sp. S124]|uniref:DMT family transporter n=1 Tax=Oceanicola sp. S124 TaxID=1042378 RepID=UPI0002558570|nr:DMT family transporter [Oceanicola sp. S124]